MKSMELSRVCDLQKRTEWSSPEVIATLNIQKSISIR